ncbi:MAG: hypothetical protein AAB473_03885 [Patescibacteria group bacterium]
MKKPLLKSDKFKKARGGTSRLLEIFCSACKANVCLYQKDGPGLLKRMYLDRISESACTIGNKNIVCASCGAHLGVMMMYEKEDRPAYRLALGAVGKKIA